MSQKRLIERIVAGLEAAAGLTQKLAGRGRCHVATEADLDDIHQGARQDGDSLTVTGPQPIPYEAIGTCLRQAIDGLGAGIPEEPQISLEPAVVLCRDLLVADGQSDVAEEMIAAYNQATDGEVEMQTPLRFLALTDWVSTGTGTEA